MNVTHAPDGLNALAARVHGANKRWWEDLHTGERVERNICELLTLVVTELSEAVEGHRKNLMDDKLPTRPMAEVELADALIRLLDIAGGYEIELDDQPMSRFQWTGNFAENVYMLTRVVTSPLSLPRTLNHAIAGIVHLSAYLRYDLFGAFEEKMAFNASREDHTREARLTANGKKY